MTSLATILQILTTLTFGALAWAGTALASSGTALASPGPAEDSAVLLTKSQALRVVFPECERALEVRRLLTDAEKAGLEKQLKRPLEERGFLVYLGLRYEKLDGVAVEKLDGVAVITNEMGKFEPITFIVAGNLDGSVRRVAVMVYRESHGGEVRARRFLAQFERKSLADPLELHRDVINVSGATISATALCNGTRKVLAAVDALYLGLPEKEILAAARADGAREIALRADSSDSGPDVAGRQSRFEARRAVMGSELRVVALLDGSNEHERAAQAECVQRALDAAEALDAVLSDWREDSELSRVNREAGKGPVAVSPAMLDFLRQSRELSLATRGAFDPTLGELVRAWGFRHDDAHNGTGAGLPAERPRDDRLASIVRQSGMAAVAIHPDARTVAFTKPHVRLDPGAIGKGLAVDAVAAALREGGVTNALVDFGSTQLGMGPGEDGVGWVVAIRDPRGAAGEGMFSDVIVLRDRACSTSGGHEKFVKFVETDGERLFPHILDPRTGRPATLCSTTSAIASTAARSDALSTALFVLGPVEGPLAIDAIADAAGLVVPLAQDGEASIVKTSRWPGALAPAR